MFGNAPKALWSRWMKPDEQNRIQLGTRALLCQEENRNILFEAGIGAFFEPKLKKRFGVVEEEHVLLSSLKEAGLSPNDIDVVVLSHLHFDHAGGLLTGYTEGEESDLVFKNATIVFSEDAWQRSLNPHPRDKASFIPRLTELLSQHGNIERVSGTSSEVLGKDYPFWISNGHTPGLLCTEIAMPDGPIVFASDLIPARAWVHVPITMGYDRFPEGLIDEKKQLLNSLVERKGRLFFTHDLDCATAKVVYEDKKFQSREELEDMSSLTQ